jgi:hypothetical protein
VPFGSIAEVEMSSDSWGSFQGRSVAEEERPASVAAVSLREGEVVTSVSLIWWGAASVR